MEKREPEVANPFRRGIALLLAERLALMTKTINVLQRWAECGYLVALD
jgi:hypothetical protein